MSIFRRKKVKETRNEQAIDESAMSAALLQALVGDGTISFEDALQIPAVAASIDFISAICARVPVKLYREDGEDTEEIRDDPRVRLLNDETGDLLNAYQMKKAWVTDYFDGRGYIYINRSRGAIKSLNYVEKLQISVDCYPDPIFKDADIVIADKRYYPHEFLRLCRDTKDGVTGKSITETNGKLLSLYYNTIVFEKRLMKTGGSRKGFITSENRLSEEVIRNMREAWRSVFADNAENMMVLNKGTDFKEASATSTELQLNENKITNANDIMQLFLLSAKALQGASDDEIVSAVKTACIPIIEQMEAAYNTALLLETEKKNMYFAADTSKLERGDLLKRYQAYEIALRSHFMQPDEVRYEEDMKPLGLDFIQLGLNDVLYFPDKGEIYTPNTNQTVSVEGRSAEVTKREMHGPDGKIIDNEPDNPESSSGLTISSDNSIMNEGHRILKEKIESGEISLTINQDVQDRHIKGTKAYEENLKNGVEKSYYYNPERLQDFLNKNANTGQVFVFKDGNVTEVFEDNQLRAFDTKLRQDTNVSKVSYSKRRTHFKPFSPKGKNRRG